jgi:murein DD-endopeptidase MepM/ murein hydrolase activator NlpD
MKTLITTEYGLRRLIKKKLKEATRSNYKLSSLYGTSMDADEITQAINSGSETVTKTLTTKKYCFPVPKINGVDYSQNISSRPQAVRTDVGKTKNKDTGEERERGHGPHEGIDFKVSVGTHVLSIADGKVVYVNEDKSSSGGIFIRIDHSELTSQYLHLSKVYVKTGQSIKKGGVIGLSGATGNITGPHLHFGLRKVGKKPADNTFSHEASLYNSFISNAGVNEYNTKKSSSKSSKKSNKPYSVMKKDYKLQLQDGKVVEVVKYRREKDGKAFVVYNNKAYVRKLTGGNKLGVNWVESKVKIKQSTSS